ncbi:MAG: hypothetical protein ACOYOU_06550 [Kiritimatiellia bacterium]
MTGAHGLFLKHHISRVFNRQDAKYAKFSRRCLSAGENIEFVGLGDLGVLAVGQIVKLQKKTMDGRWAHLRFIDLYVGTALRRPLSGFINPELELRYAAR